MAAHGRAGEHPRRSPRWRAAVPVVAVLGGLLFATAARSTGPDPRAGSRTDLVDVISVDERGVLELTGRVAGLQREVEQRARSAGGAAGAEQQRADAAAVAAGVAPARGRGLVVTLDDSPRDPGDPALPADTRPDDLVVHEQDLRGVVNALWAGGASALEVMDQRLTSTSALRCAGNVLTLHGRTYGPPFVVRAVGDPVKLRAALDEDRSVRIYREWVARVGLGYDVRAAAALALPAATGTVGLSVASPEPVS
ncbi:uncharacterized protein YlxW (UPF0749 family) [Motilibacter rhizosphaerae]|uniref:Uncharacterized protein YlxW (UPF0749 family) n=1 Tax=Motilibacter rhizosphaerae TaxID=598652 RepID=A0A4Q7NXX9_9ACTN|nr:DUF881 domain-containing protein [Motilibacter rhizosphaerae]RZS91242.1 uncharacterized protein YlxW (UPF0749 family) [Motilibacter rhizosphaerae]